MAAQGETDSWKLRGGLTQLQKEEMVNFLETRKDAFACSTADLGGFTGTAMEIPLTSEKSIFSHAHRL